MPGAPTAGWPDTCCGWLLRHGETQGNAAGRVQGQTGGTGPSRRGQQQVRAAAAALGHSRVRPASILSSDLERCRQTARALAAELDLPIHWAADLRERCLGALEGASWPDVPGEDVGIVAGQVADPDARPAGGESLAELGERVFRGLRTAAALPGPVLVVTHGGPIRLATAPATRPGMPWAAVAHAVPLVVCLRAHGVRTDDPRGAPRRPA